MKTKMRPALRMITKVRLTRERPWALSSGALLTIVRPATLGLHTTQLSLYTNELTQINTLTFLTICPYYKLNNITTILYYTTQLK